MLQLKNIVLVTMGGGSKSEIHNLWLRTKFDSLKIKQIRAILSHVTYDSYTVIF